MCNQYRSARIRAGAGALLLLCSVFLLALSAAANDVEDFDDATPDERYIADPSVPAEQKMHYIRKALRAGSKRLVFDVVELGTKFAFDEAPVDEHSHPLYGNPFITQGVIYPGGTITVDAEGNANGVIIETDAEGNVTTRPEFPELVLGTWICRGTVFADDGFNIASGPTVYTHQLYDFHAVGNEFGRLSFETTGLELIDIGKPIQRAVTGGTGPYRNARGEVQQVFLGVNSSVGFALRFATRLN